MKELLFRDPREYIHFEFQMRNARRPAYSMRAFARDLEVSPSSLNDFIKGRVGMSRDRAENIALKLNWSSLRKEHFVDLIQAKFEKDPGLRQASQMRVRSRLKEGSFGKSLDAFKVISDWYHLVIRELLDVTNGLTTSEIAKELKLERPTVDRAIKRMLKLELLEETEKGLKPTDFGSHFGDEAPSDAIVEFHSQILDLAQKALKEIPFGKRESHSLIYSIREDDVPKMYAEVKKSILEIANRYAYSDGRNEVQILALQVFPIWKKKEGPRA